MNPSQDLTTSSSVQYAGARDPASTADFNRRARAQGVVDLTSPISNAGKRKPTEFSVPNGKRTQPLYTANLVTSMQATTLQKRWD